YQSGNRDRGLNSTPQTSPSLTLFHSFTRSILYIQLITMASPRPASPLTSGAESGPESKSAGAGSGAVASGSSVSRPSSPTPPGGPRAAMRRRAAADHKETLRNARPSSTRSAGAGGSSGTMLKLYTDESPGLRVDPVVVLVLSLGFIFSVVGLHVIAKVTRKFSA
ncbi:Protein transport protein Sec61 subunit beta, partial [Penicillium angulare]